MLCGRTLCTAVSPLEDMAPTLAPRSKSAATHLKDPAVVGDAVVGVVDDVVYDVDVVVDIERTAQ